MKPITARNIRWGAILVLLVFAYLFFDQMQPGVLGALGYIAGSLAFYIILSEMLERTTDYDWHLSDDDDDEPLTPV